MTQETDIQCVCVCVCVDKKVSLFLYIFFSRPMALVTEVTCAVAVKSNLN